MELHQDDPWQPAKFEIDDRSFPEYSRVRSSREIVFCNRRQTLEVSFYVEAWEQTPRIPAEELVRRLLCRFPSTAVDRERGDDYVQAGLDRLIAIGAPEQILDAHRLYFGNVVLVSIAEPPWDGATATSFLHNTSPPLGDVVSFDIEGDCDDTTFETIIRELAIALGMIPFSSVPFDTASDEECACDPRRS